MSVKGPERIPVCEPFLDGNEERYVLEALRSGWISSSGTYVTQFEEGLAAYCGRRFGVSTTSGTTALHLALLALGIGRGDEVIIPDLSMIATLCAVLYCDATPVFVDVEADTWNIDPAAIEEKITRRTRALLPVHLFGHPADMARISAIAKRHDLYVIEDAAEAHGALYEGEKCGGLGDIGCFSFFANKLITTGEGGMLVTDDEALRDRARYFRNLCFNLTGPRDYLHQELGFNYRFTNLQAALGLAQLEELDRHIEMRRITAQRYHEGLEGIAGIHIPLERPDCRSVYWMYAITVDGDEFGMDRDTLMSELQERGIDSRMLFKPLHSQPLLAARGLADTSLYPVTERLAQTGLYLPSSTSLSAGKVARICETIRSLGRQG